MSIPVICDRCRSTGNSGEGDFSHLGDLLDFEPVSVQPRANGWDPDAQRAFIALLATTGSKRRAALAIGRNAFGIEQLLKRPDAGSFRTAVEQAQAIYKQHGAMKIAAGVADAAARNAQLTAPSRKLLGRSQEFIPVAGVQHTLQAFSTLIIGTDLTFQIFDVMSEYVNRLIDVSKSRKGEARRATSPICV